MQIYHLIHGSLSIYKTSVAKLEVIGCTDVKLQWKQLGSKGKASYGPCKVSELCHVSVDDGSKSDTLEVDSGSRPSAFYDLINAAPQCSVSRHVRPGPSKHGVQAPKDIDDVISNTMASDYLGAYLQPPMLAGNLKEIYDTNIVVDHGRACQLASFAQGSDEWSKARDVRITGSKCYSLYTHAAKGPNADWAKKLATLEKSRMFAGNSATCYGQKCESLALGLYEQMCEGEVVLRCGLIVPPNCPWLGFSPDGVVMKDGNWKASQTDRSQKPFVWEKHDAP